MKSNSKNKPSSDYKWVIKIAIITFFLGFVFSTFSELILSAAGLLSAILIVLFIILIGIIADAIGVSVAAADSTAVLAMCARKVRGAKQTLKLIKSAAKVSNICNDVIGDICGIVSGTSSAVIVLRLIDFMRWSDSTNKIWITIAISSVIAALTVGGKAISKNIAIKKANQIIFAVGYIMSIFSFKERKQERMRSRAKNGV